MNFQDAESLEFFVVILFAMILYFLERFTKPAKPRVLKETFANIINFIILKYIFVGALFVLQLKIYIWFAQFSPFQSSPSILGFVVATVAVDFAYYWKHRIEHLNPFFWSEHIVHHSSNEFNFSTCLRLPWLGGFLTFIFFLPLILIGILPIQVLVGHKIVLMYQYLIHTKYFRNLGPLEFIFNTPSSHRVHHGKNLKYLNKNFAGIFIIWDKIFKTFEPEIEEVDYIGTNEQHSYNPFVINFHPWLELFRKIKSFDSTKERLNFLWKL